MANDPSAPGPTPTDPPPDGDGSGGAQSPAVGADAATPPPGIPRAGGVERADQWLPTGDAHPQDGVAPPIGW